MTPGMDVDPSCLEVGRAPLPAQGGEGGKCFLEEVRLRRTWRNNRGSDGWRRGEGAFQAEGAAPAKAQRHGPQPQSGGFK